MSTCKPGGLGNIRISTDYDKKSLWTLLSSEGANEVIYNNPLDFSKLLS
jgi:hypothetical protein